MNMKDKIDFELKEQTTIDRLTEFKNEFQLKDGAKIMAKRKIMNGIDKRKKTRDARFVPAFMTVLLLMTMIASVSVLAFPEIAVKYAGALPIVKELARKEDDVNLLNGKVAALQENINEKESMVQYLEAQVEQLEIKLKEISGEEIPEVITSENEDETLNIQLQSLTVNFVKNMYKGDYEAAAQFCTPDFASFVKEHPDSILMRKDNRVIFTQITNIAVTEKGIYLVFLRLNDSVDGEADYQIDFEIIEQNGKYLISFAGMNA